MEPVGLGPNYVHLIHIQSFTVDSSATYLSTTPSIWPPIDMSFWSFLHRVLAPGLHFLCWPCLMLIIAQNLSQCMIAAKNQCTVLTLYPVAPSS